MSRRWMAKSACLDTDSGVMQPEVASREDVNRAMVENCHGCPVRLECLRDAEGQDGPYGIWGGKWFGDPPKRPMLQLVCTQCGGGFEAQKATAMVCSPRCRKAMSRERAA